MTFYVAEMIFFLWPISLYCHMKVDLGDIKLRLNHSKNDLGHIKSVPDLLISIDWGL